MRKTKMELCDIIFQFLLDIKAIEKSLLPIKGDYENLGDYFNDCFAIILQYRSFITKDKFDKHNKSDISYDEIIDYINHEFDLLIEKEILNLNFITSDNDSFIIYNVLKEYFADGKFYTLYEMQNSSELLNKFSNQKIHAILGKLCRSNLAEKVVDKKKQLYKILDIDDKKIVIKDNFVMPIEPIVNSFYAHFAIEDQQVDNEKIKGNINSLTDYLKTLINLEMDIFSLKRRYNELRKECIKTLIDNSKDYNLVDELIAKKRNIILNNIEKTNNLIHKIPELKNLIRVQKPSKPKKPRFNLNAPQNPVMLKPNIFNKKKINKENQDNLLEYEKQLKIYNDAKKVYENELEVYNCLLKKYNEEIKQCDIEEKRLNEEAYQKELTQYNIAKEKYVIDLEKYNKELLAFDKNYIEERKEQLKKYSFYQNVLSMKYEMEYIISIIKQDIETLNKMYSLNVIYQKYRNYNSISTFYEYLISGRCNSLEGADGAYNLHEKEIRDDKVINKLDVVIDSLEEIKLNQKHIYNELQAVNKSLDLINGQLLVNNILQVVQIGQLNKIIENTDSINYNTQVAAFYAKKTANYTAGLFYTKMFNL